MKHSSLSNIWSLEVSCSSLIAGKTPVINREGFKPLFLIVQPRSEIRSMQSRFMPPFILVYWPHFKERNIGSEGQEVKLTRNNMILSHRTFPWEGSECNSNHCLPYYFMQGFFQYALVKMLSSRGKEDILRLLCVHETQRKCLVCLISYPLNFAFLFK